MILNISALGIINPPYAYACLHREIWGELARSSPYFQSDFFQPYSRHCKIHALKLLHFRPKWINGAVFSLITLMVDALFHVPLPRHSGAICWIAIFHQLTAIFLLFLIWSNNLISSAISKYFDIEERGWCYLIKNLI